MAAEIKITLNLFAGLENHLPAKSRKGNKVQVSKGTSIRDILKEQGIPGEEVNIIMVNGRNESPDYIPENNDEISLFPPIGGG